MNGKPITFFSFDYPPLDGGVSRLCAEIASGLGGRGVDVHVVSQSVTGNGASIPDLPETRVTGRRPLREWRAYRELRRRGGPVISGIWYPEGLLACLAGAKPHVILAHGSELMPTASRLRRGPWKRLLRRVLAKADLVVANSSYTRTLVQGCSPTASVVALPLAVDHLRFTPEGRGVAKAKYGLTEHKVILSVSRVRRYKGHDLVFKALAALPVGIRENFAYLIAGKGPDREALEAEAERLGLGKIVRWLGYVPEGDLPDLYRAADLFALCTRETQSAQEVEGFGLVFLEAQSCGTPVVGARTGGIPDAVADGEGGWLIAQDDTEALGRLFEQLADDPASFEEAGRAARARVERDFTWEQYLDRFVSELVAKGIEIV